MERLISDTAAYKIFCGDKAADRLSHAYMLYYQDGENLRRALKLFALKYFGADPASREGKLIMSEGLPDLKVYPAQDKKLTADVAAEIVDDAVLKPLEFDKKLYVISCLEGASAIFQNKLLKVLEEPPAGVGFLLGAISLAPVLDTVKSRVKTLEIPLFTPEQIFEALERQGQNPLNRPAAEACGGSLGVAQNMLSGGWYEQTVKAAEDICAADTVAKATGAAFRYGDFKYKKELLSEMQRRYFEQLKNYARGEDFRGVQSKQAAAFAVEAVNSALADLKFNANFSSLLYSLLLNIARKNGG